MPSKNCIGVAVMTAQLQGKNRKHPIQKRMPTPACISPSREKGVTPILFAIYAITPMQQGR